MAIKPKLVPNVQEGIDDFYLPQHASKEAKICLECPLPASKCNPTSCKRYKEEIKKISPCEKKYRTV